MAGLYPNSYDVKQLSDILYNKKNPFTKSSRWVCDHPEVSQLTGHIPDLECFDAQFFKVHYRLCNLMDPMSRKMLEQTYQALFDAGINPEYLSGKKVGVYIGTCFSEAEKACLYTASAKTGLSIAGCNRSMFANRISYYLNLKGPSMSIDVSCCSSASALELAYAAISRGECEAAIVGGANLCLHPQSSVHYGRVINISKDGKTKSFDKNADGCSKSEAINILFLQKAKDSLRIYAYIVYAKCEYLSLPECETGAKYGFIRNPTDMTGFLKRFYDQAHVSPKAVQYVEAFGAASLESDKIELDVIDEFFCKGRSKPLMVGSVMSNIGYVESASGTTALTKVLLGYHCGKLAGNLHYNTPRDDIAAIRDGRIEILTDNKEFVPTYTAVNGLSLSGSFSHVLLHGFYKEKDLNKYKSNIPRIVLCSGRQESSVKKIINDLKSRPIDPEEHALLHHFHETRVTGHLGRGFVILDTKENNNTVSLSEECAYFDQGKRPLWFVYSGMGSQWVGMGKDLMRIPVFAAAMEKCHQVLKTKGINIVDIITSDDKKMFDNILHSFVGINAIQIGLTDILRAMDIIPDNIIGHSVGEIGCAYADGCLTAEETILCAYYRGLVSVQTPFIRGSMAAVGLGYKEISKICPPEIEVACHNSAESSTISGPAEIMSEFVTNLVKKGIFAKEVPCSNIAYHSRYIAEAGPALLQSMKNIIKAPRLRSPRWVSTSVPEDRWHEPLAKYSSAEYHTNNLLSPVLFEETSQMIPPDAVLIEVAPHGLLQAILKRSLPKSCKLLPLTRRGHPDNSVYLLEAIGKLYMEGFYPKVRALYPKIEFPVSTSTPMLSHLVEWAHQEKWSLPLPSAGNTITASASKDVISTYDAEHTYLKGHVIRGKNLYPFSAALVSVWRTLAASLNTRPEILSVQFENVYLYSQPILHNKRQLYIDVTLHKGTGLFEVLNEKSLVIRGTIVPEVTKTKQIDDTPISKTNVSSSDIYRLLFAKEYQYQNEFCSIYSVNESLTEAKIEWKDNWIAFLDGIIQLNILKRKHHTVSKLNFIRKMSIDVNKQRSSAITNDGRIFHNAKILNLLDITVCGGVVIENPKFIDLPSLNEDSIILKTPATRNNNKAREGDYNLPLEETINRDSGVTLKIGQVGDLDSISWVHAIENSNLGIDVQVAYSGVNVVYVNKLMGTQFIENNDQNKSVIDFSGTAKSGTRVMGIVQRESIASPIKVDPEFLLPVPSHWTLEDAATVPLSYSLAFYILFVKAKIAGNFPILIQGGAGALGLALISIALAHGCEVFTTVSSKSKKQFLKKMFPQLQDDHIGHSSDLSFLDFILHATQGNGCQLIVSHSKGQLKNFHLKCLGFNGKLVDTAVIHDHEDFNYGMNNLTRQRAYIPIDISSLFQPKYKEEALYIRSLMVEGIRRGYVRPLPRVTLAAEKAAHACRLQAAGCNRGRILLDLQQIKASIQTRVKCSSSSWQLIISDDEIVAIKLAERLMKRGAKKLAFLLSNISKCIDVHTTIWSDDLVEVKVTKASLKNINSSFVIQECEKNGGLENLFIITSNERAVDMKCVVNSLSAALSNSKIKHTTFVSCVNEELEPLYKSIIGSNKSVSQIKLPEIKLVYKENLSRDMISINNAIEIIEKALSSSKEKVLAQPNNSKGKTLLEQILQVAGLKLQDVPENAKDFVLSNLNLNNSNLLAIQGFLGDVYDVRLNIEDIQELSLQSIYELERNCIEFDFTESQGVDAYFPKLYTDELLYTSDVVFMTTLRSTNLYENYINKEEAFLCIIPGVEGHFSAFTKLCERLKLPALTLQPGLDHPNETVSEQANRYIDTLSKKAALKDNFYLAGYESGVMVALEMASILEKRGLTGTVFCIGGSPSEVIDNFKNNLKTFKTTEYLQIAVLKHAYLLITHKYPSIFDQLDKNMSWKEKINTFTDTILGKYPHSIQYTRKWIDYIYTKLSSLLNCKPEFKKISSKIIFLRPKSFSSVDSSLQHFSDKKIICYQLEAPLSSALHDLMCTSIINQHLDSGVLEKFKNRNICQTYVLNADGLMTS
ncbi:fatty acid synthase-like [Aricia agestis]|uniref:fatty acid synthase-like n=1 Tax=Aricia agestis TaxID=91739 RepID=UPI001C20B729|nr:fatty acid synthase-like [Aricia agestis]